MTNSAGSSALCWQYSQFPGRGHTGSDKFGGFPSRLAISWAWVRLGGANFVGYLAVRRQYLGDVRASSGGSRNSKFLHAFSSSLCARNALGHFLEMARGCRKNPSAVERVWRWPLRGWPARRTHCPFARCEAVTKTRACGVRFYDCCDDQVPCGCLSSWLKKMFWLCTCVPRRLYLEWGRRKIPT